MYNKIKVKKLNTGSKSLTLPRQEKGNEGNVGKWYHEKLDERYPMNHGSGPDLPELNNLEVKTRNRGSKAPHTMGTMTYENIVNTPYKKSCIHDKMQVQNRMKYDNTFNTVVSESIYDFRNPEIQSLIEDSYEQARQQLILQGGPGPGTTIGGLYGVFEWKTGNSYEIGRAHV